MVRRQTYPVAELVNCDSAEVVVVLAMHLFSRSLGLHDLDPQELYGSKQTLTARSALEALQ
jgi:hypothetical protein